MAELIDISNDKFWDILFDEACVEGQQAKRIEKALKAISTTESEIRAKAIDEFAERLCVELSEKAGVIKVHGVDFDILTVDGATEILLDLAEQLKEE